MKLRAIKNTVVFLSTALVVGLLPLSSYATPTLIGPKGTPAATITLEKDKLYKRVHVSSPDGKQPSEKVKIVIVGKQGVVVDGVDGGKHEPTVVNPGNNFLWGYTTINSGDGSKEVEITNNSDVSIAVELIKAP